MRNQIFWEFGDDEHLVFLCRDWKDDVKKAFVHTVCNYFGMKHIECENFMS